MGEPAAFTQNMLDGVFLEESRLYTNGIYLHVVQAGPPQGEPVFLLHGFPEFWYGWRHQIAYLVGLGFRVVIPDQRGYNLSDRPPGIDSYRLHQLTGDILGLADTLGYAQFNLAGHDWGAAVAWALAMQAPERVKRLAILNVPHPAVMLHTIKHSPRQMLKSWYIAFFQIPGLADGLMRLNHFAGAANLLRRSGKPDTFSPDDLAEYRKAWTNSHGLTHMIHWYRALARSSSSIQRDTRIHVPTLILWGKQDVALAYSMAEQSLTLCDQGRLVAFEDATHWVQHDAAQEVNRLLGEYFKGMPSD